jgi:leader peptidase (prepilin peptidase)/N-methyltransferase
MEALGFGLFGLVLGSFLNVCIDRLPRGESVAEGRSRCDSCGRVLSARELIPLLSYAALGGRCRTCRARIPLRVLLVELGTGLLFGLIWLRYPASLKAVLIAAYAAL